MENTSKNFALQLGSLISLYVSIVALVSLLFAIITVLYPDASQGYWEYDTATSSIRTSIAFLVVFFPTYIVLTRLVNNVRRTEQGVYLTLTKWLIYISLLIGGGVILGDLVTVLLSFLNGEITVRFILKAIVLFVIVGTACVYYILDARSYWQSHEKDSIYYAIATSFIVCASVVFGFSHTESPKEVRAMRIDANQITDLQNIQSHIEEYYRLHNKLPATLDVAFEAIEMPQAVEGRSAYVYKLNSSESFSLCAAFAHESKATDTSFATPLDFEGMIIKNPYNWEHPKGDWCFERLVQVGTQTKPIN